MATGTGTGTPVSAGTSPSLSTLRNRVRTQLMNASGFTEPLVVTTSSETLTTLRDRIELRLQDSGNAIWATGDIDEALEEALEQYSQRSPDSTIDTVTLAADGREIDISSLTDVIRVEKVWWDYDSSDPSYPPNWRQFEVWPGQVLYIDDPTEPTSGDTVRIWYTRMHTISGLNAATSTTIPAEDIPYLINGAAGFAAQMRAIAIAEDLNVDKDVVKRLEDWAEEKLKNFRYGISLKPPAWQRYSYAYDQSDIDEAIRWALGRVNEISPEPVTTSVTLSSAGREVDISSITDYLDVQRVWWPYTSSDPEYPPKWRDFELWKSDDIVFINVDSEPASGDVVRIFYTRLRTINGLDSASVTTIDEETQTLIVTGATGMAAQERVQEQPGYRVPRKLNEWAIQRLREFERGLKALAHRRAARHSGIAPMGALDRWDKGDGW